MVGNALVVVVVSCMTQPTWRTTPNELSHRAMTLETLHMQDACGVNGNRTRCLSSASHWAHRSGADCLAAAQCGRGAVWSNATIIGLHASVDISGILREPWVMPLTAQAIGMVVATWVMPWTFFKPCVSTCLVGSGR